MAPAVAHRVSRTTTPDAIDAELAALWRELARQQHPVARAVMSNLVVFRGVSERTNARAADLDAMANEPPLDEVAARHPSRIIVIDHARRPQDACAPFAASVAVATFGPPHARYAVEQIAVQSACSDQSLPSIVRRLLRGDAPTSVWWMEDLSQLPLIEAIAVTGRQLVYDSRQWRDVRRGVLALAGLLNRLDLADVNWRRLTPLRRALIHACRTSDVKGLRRADVEIRHRPGDGALAWLTLGWLSTRLGWPASASPQIEESRKSEDVLTIVVGGAPAELTLTLDSHRVHVTHRGAAPFTMSVPQEGEADAVVAELRNLSHDASLHDALSALVARFS